MWGSRGLCGGAERAGGFAVDDVDRWLAWDAARGVCVACGRGLGWDGVIHHRVLKGMGGRKGGRQSGRYLDRPPFTVVLHDRCHKQVHGNPAAARAAGLIVPSWGDPAATPLGRLLLDGP